MAALDILYIGSIRPGQTCLQRMLVLRELGHRVVGLELYPPEHFGNPTFFQRARRRLFGLADAGRINQRILEHVNQKRWDVLWIDKGLLVEANTLHQVKQLQPDCVLVGYSPDDMMHRACSSRQFRAHLPLYDIFFTNKSYGVSELQGIGARRVVFFDNGFDRHTHAPVEVTDEDRRQVGGPVGFIGDFEAERARSMNLLAESGVSVRIWGPNWHKLTKSHPNLQIEYRPLLGREYARAICAFDINLGFLRKYARDLQTTRSVEIPACGGFMIAERTTEHLNLFEESKEAEFFSSDEELLRKVRYYLEHPEERTRIALAGRERCLVGKYSNHDRLGAMLEHVRALMPRKHS